MTAFLSEGHGLALGDVVVRQALQVDPRTARVIVDGDRSDLSPTSLPAFPFEAVGRIDSIKGGIRTTFTEVPDAPISRVVLSMQGAKKGLIVNSTDICKGAHRVNALFNAHNGASFSATPPLQATGCGQAKSRR